MRDCAARGRDHDMVHIYDTCCEPFDGYACGAQVPLNDRIAEESEEIDCIVCCELDQARAMKPCRRCGWAPAS